MTTDDATLFRKALQAALSDFELPPLADRELSILVAHYSLMIEWNRRMNLTRITDPVEAARFHYAESLFGGRFIADAKSILDIGSGAGFPGLPLAVSRKDVAVTALESSQKKALFLTEARTRLELENFTVVPKRLEEFDWSGYDLLTCRALDRAEKVLPKVVKRLSRGQRLMVYCGAELAGKIASLRKPFERHPIPQSTNRFIAVVG
jgi:16S rRNA (guanine527-N7)-methyltransferase